MLPRDHRLDRIEHPLQWFASEGQTVEGYLLSGEALQAFYDLGYLVIIFPVLGSGLAITIHSWRSLARRRSEGKAGFGDYAVTGWNTYAQVHNTYRALQEIPGVLDRLGDFFGSTGSSSGSSSKDSKGMVGVLVVVMVILAVLSGILTTYSIIQSTRRAVINSDALRALRDEAMMA